MITKKLLFAVTIMTALLTVGVAEKTQGQLTLSFGDLTVAPNTAGQTIEVFVTGGSPVDAIQLNILIGDGGAITGGTNPNFDLVQDVDILAGTIFAGNNNGVSAARLAQAGFAFDSTATATGTVAANGRIATLTIDTTGVDSGSFSISTDSGAGIQGPTTFSGPSGIITPTQANGVIMIEDSVTKGDVNMDGTVSFLDIGPFILVLQNGAFQAEADCDCNGTVNFLDIQPFINILANP